MWQSSGSLQSLAIQPVTGQAFSFLQTDSSHEVLATVNLATGSAAASGTTNEYLSWGLAISLVPTPYFTSGEAGDATHNPQSGLFSVDKTTSALDPNLRVSNRLA